MEVHLNFDKKTVSRGLFKYLATHMPEEADRKSISRLMNKKKLAYHDANQLIQGLLSAMIMGDGDVEDEEEIEISPDTEEDPTMRNETGSQNEEGQSQTQTSTQETQEGSQKNEKIDLSKVCRFYRNGDCKFGAKCRQEHPKFCKKFTKHGLQRHNQNGCDSKCGKLHPNACRNSLRTKECDREKCRFFHIRGTKNTFTPTPVGGWGERERERWREESRKNGPEEIRSNERSNDTKTKDQVFIESQQAMFQMITKISERMDMQMEELKSWKSRTNQNNRTMQEPLQWRIPQRETNWASQ